jgi:hypothetical protein
MSQITDEMASEYARISKRAAGDPGTAGDEGEENWACLLREWLPSIFSVVTKGQILSLEGTLSHQVDVLVLRPSYPKKLPTKKKYLAAGVIAAFECKNTLKAAHITSAVERAVEIRSLLPVRTGTPYQELHSPIIFGLLAHSHSWKSEGSHPVENIEHTLLEADKMLLTHPNQMPELICVSDLATWVAHRLVFVGPASRPWNAEIAQIYGSSGSAISTYGCASHEAPGQKPTFTPVGAMLASLMDKMALEYADLRPLADYFRQVGMWGQGKGAMRFWPSSIYSEGIRPKVTGGGLVYGAGWDEWRLHF